MKKILFFLIICLSLCICASADDVSDMLSGKQDFVILGSIKDIENDIIVVTVDYVLDSSESGLIGTDIKVNKFSYSYCVDHVPQSFNNPIVSDNVVMSIDQSGDVYKVKNGSYKVDSNEYANCKIIMHEDSKDEDCVKDLLEVTCYIRSNAKVKEFEFDDDGRIYAVYPQTAEQCIYFVDDSGSAIIDTDVPDTLPTIPHSSSADEDTSENDLKWIYAIAILAIGSLIGIAVAYVYMVKKRD